MYEYIYMYGYTCGRSIHGVGRYKLYCETVGAVGRSVRSVGRYGRSVHVKYICMRSVNTNYRHDTKCSHWRLTIRAFTPSLRRRASPASGQGNQSQHNMMVLPNYHEGITFGEGRRQMCSGLRPSKGASLYS